MSRWPVVMTMGVVVKRRCDRVNAAAAANDDGGRGAHRAIGGRRHAEGREIVKTNMRLLLLLLSGLLAALGVV